MKFTTICRLLFLLPCLAKAEFASWNPENRPCQTEQGQNSGICLTSFVWCADVVESSGKLGCSYPANTYPISDSWGQQNTALLLDNAVYNISWKNANPNYNVKLEWLFPNKGQTVPSVKWTALTDPKEPYLFNPGQILDIFPDAKESAIQANLPNTNYITISQPDLDAITGQGRVDKSHGFHVVPASMKGFLTTQHALGRGAAHEKWSLTAMVGALVFPVVFALSCGYAWKRGRQSAAKIKVW